MSSVEKLDNFVKVYMDAFKKNESQTWVAKELNVTPALVSIYKKRLIESGVELPTLRRNNAQMDQVDAKRLNAIIRSKTKAVA